MDAIYTHASLNSTGDASIYLRIPAQFQEGLEIMRTKI